MSFLWYGSRDQGNNGARRFTSERLVSARASKYDCMLVLSCGDMTYCFFITVPKSFSRAWPLRKVSGTPQRSESSG